MHEVKILLSGEPAFPNVFKHLITITSPAGCSRQVYSLSRIFTWLLLSHWDLARLSRLRCRFILLSLTSSDDILRDMSGAACPPTRSWSVMQNSSISDHHLPMGSSNGFFQWVLPMGLVMSGTACPTHLQLMCYVTINLLTSNIFC